MFVATDKSIEKEMSLIGKAKKSSRPVELLGITLDKNLNLKSRNLLKFLSFKNNLALEQITKKSSFPNSKFYYTRTNKSFRRYILYYQTSDITH